MALVFTPGPLTLGMQLIPGMMTGQVIAGEDPHNTARYQIMVMCMIFGSAGISVSLCLALVKSDVAAADV